MKATKLFLFGVPRLERDEKPVELSRRKVVALMAYLAMSGQPQSRDTLAALLWPDNDQSSARANLRRDLSRLKQALGEALLKVDRNQVALAPAPSFWLDVAVFKQALADVQQDHPDARSICDQCAAKLAQAVTLYQDEFMAGFALPDSAAFDEWHFFQSEALRQELATALQLLIDWHVGRGQIKRAIVYGRRWVALDALHEPAQRRLMQLYAWSGQHAAAQRQYQETVRLLEEELGVEPEEETSALYEAIRGRQLPEPRTRTGPRQEDAGGRYELLDLLAVGGHAEVYVGRDRESGENVVIKRLKQELLVKDAAYLQRFIREGQALSRLEHPNIVRMVSTYEEGEQHHIVMEYVPGGSLRQLLDEEGQLPLEQALDIALELADALARAHHLNIIHRDLKPDNVLVAGDGTPRLTDFGLARLRREDTRLTRTGAVMGSPAYMSPEALRGEPLEPRSDIWSFGILLFEMLAGRKPFEGKQLTPVLVSILQDDAPPITSFRRDIPRALAALLQRMLQKDAQRRPASMRQVAAELEAIRAGSVEPLFLARDDAGDAPSPEQAAASAIPYGAAGDVEKRAVRFVGREQTLARLSALLEESIQGTGNVAFIMGEAGQGKTSLLRAFVRRSQEEHPQLVISGGNCNAYIGSGDPYLPFREILEMLSGDVALLALGGDLSKDHARRLQLTAPRTLHALVETGPDLLDTFVPARKALDIVAALPEAEASWRPQLQKLAAARARQRERSTLQQNDLFEQYARVLRKLSEQDPLLLYLDDLQWIDQGSANLLLHLGRRVQDCPIMIVGAYRPADVALGRDGDRHPLEAPIYELQRLYGRVAFDLNDEPGRRFVDALLDSEPNVLDETFRETLFQQTGGHPLFTIELLRSMQERGDLAQDDEGRWTAQPELDWQTLPARVEAAIGERISRLAPALRELLEVASVEGEIFTAEAVARVLRRDARLTARQLSSELDRRFLLVRALGLQQVEDARLSRYRFRHILIQRYLYNSMDAVERVYQHEAVGEALETLYGEERAAIAPELARHFALATLPERAASYFLQAGDQARQAIALQEALRYFQLALGHWSEDNRVGRAALLRRIGECQWIIGDLHGALATYEDCYQLFEQTGDLQGAGAVQRAVGRLYWEIGERKRSLAYYHRSLQTLEKIPESVELAWTLSSISQMHMLASQYDDALAWGQRAVDMATRLQAQEVRTHALNNIGVAYMELGQMDRGKTMVRESLQLALALGLPHDACRAYLNLGEVPAGDYDERYAVLQELAAYAASVHAPLYAGSAQIELADIEWERGQWRAARARWPEIERWMDRAPSIGYLRGISSALLGRMYNDLGQLEKALEVLQREEMLVRSQDEVQLLGPHFGQMARALAELGRDQEAVAILREMLSAVEAQPYVHRDSVAPLLFASTWLTRRQPAPTALSMARRCHALLVKADAFQIKPDVAASLCESNAGLLLVEGKEEAAAEQLREAAGRWRNLGLPYDEVRALIGLGTLLSGPDTTSEVETIMERATVLLRHLADQLDDDADRQGFLASPLLKSMAPRYRQSFQEAGREERRGATSDADNVALPPSEASQRAAQNLPVQPTPFVGRQNEVAEITSILGGEAEQRLLTLVGPGGIGKTRLALAAAAKLVDHFQHGVFFVPLAPLSSAEHIVSALFESLDLTPFETSDLRRQLLDYLRERQLLLVIDNFEHLLQGVDLVADILQHAGRVKIITTSRERLNLSAETIFPVGGLDYPAQLDAGQHLQERALRRYSAVDLLLQRAQMTTPGLTLDEDDLQHALRICHMVQGMPLALVLAAGWLELLTFEEIADELAQSLSVLESTARDLPDRQRSVHAVFEYSWKRLADDDRQAFMALSVCRGGFTRQAAEAIAGAGLHALRTLTNKSFIVATRKGRFEIHEVLRHLGLEHLRASGGAEVARQAHADYYLAALRDRERDLRGGRQLQALKEIEVELENVRGAWRWALQQGDAALVDGALETLFLFGYMPSRYAESIELLRAAGEQFAQAAEAAPSPLWGRIAARLTFLQTHGRPAEANSGNIEAALAVARASGDMREVAFALLAQGGFTVIIGRDAQGAIPIVEEALAQYQALDDAFYTVLTKIWLGYCHGNATGLENFNRYMREALALAQATENMVYAANAISNLAAAAYCEGDYGAAERYSHEALAIAQEMGLRLAIAHGKVQVSLSHLLKGDLETARMLARDGLREAQEINYATTINYALSILSVCHSLEGDPGEGQRLVEEAMTKATTVFGRILAEWAAAIAACEGQAFDKAWQHAEQSTRIAYEAGYPGMTTWALPVLATVSSTRSDFEQAVSWLALAEEHRLSPSGWIQRSSSLEQMRDRLKRQVGHETFEDAWRQGATLALETWLEAFLGGVTHERDSAPNRQALALPTPATPLVGRDTEITQLRQLLTESGRRLVTLVGPGGIGKTRLALSLAGDVFELFDLVCFVNLTELQNAEQIAPAINAGLRLRMAGRDSKQQLIDALRERKALLILDNFEHLLSGAPFLVELLAQLPDLTILTTSRERLDLSGETIYAVRVLAFPAGAPDAPFEPEAVECAAVQLLLQQAQLTIPDTVLDDEQLSATVRIARLVQGMPLALMLAAGWIDVMSFSEIAGQIAADLDFLSSTIRDLPERQRSVRAAFNASWRYLDSDAQAVFRKLAVFRGGFTRQAAREIAGADLHVLRMLVNKSFVSARRGDRFDVHELLRQLGEEALQEAGEAQATQQAHSSYYLQAVAAQNARLKGSEQLQAVEQIDADFENVRAAWRWAVHHGRIAEIDQALEALAIFFTAYRRNPGEFVDLIRLARQHLVNPSALDLPGSRLLTALGHLLSYAASPEPDTREDLRRSLDLAQRHGSAVDEAWALYGLGLYHLWVDQDLEEALAFFAGSHELYEAASERYFTATALDQIAYCQKGLGRLQEAARGHAAALALRRTLGDPINAAVSLGHLGEIYLCLGDFEQAGQFDREALREARQVGQWFPLPAVDARLALRRFLRGEIEEGARDAEDAYRTALETRAQVAGIGRPYALAVMSLSKSVAGDYEAGRELAQQGNAIAHNLTVLGQLLSQWALSVALVGLNEDAGTWQAATTMLDRARITGHTGLLTWPLPVLSILYARQQAYEKATELLSLAHAHPTSLSGWLAHWPLIQDLRETLARELGEARYESAWNRGRDLEPGAVAG